MGRSARCSEPIDSFSAVKAVLHARDVLTGWRRDDTRHSFATVLAEAGIAEPVADAVLNHRQAAARGGVLGIYQRSTRWPEQVEAMKAWGVALGAALSPNVIRLHTAKA